MKRSGPSTNPWGMPWDRGAVEEVQLLIWMYCCLFVRYDFNQERAVPVMFREDSRQKRRMEWLRVSKAEVRSRRMRSRSLVALRRAVSVLC